MQYFIIKQSYRETHNLQGIFVSQYISRYDMNIFLQK